MRVQGTKISALADTRMNGHGFSAHGVYNLFQRQLCGQLMPLLWWKPEWGKCGNTIAQSNVET